MAKNRKKTADPGAVASEAELKTTIEAQLGGYLGMNPESGWTVANIQSAIRNHEPLCGKGFGKQLAFLSTFSETKKRIKLEKQLQVPKKARAEKSRKTKKRQQEIIAAVRKRLHEHSLDSVDYARHVVENENRDPQTGKLKPGWSYSSIRRATLGMKKAKRN